MARDRRSPVPRGRTTHQEGKRGEKSRAAVDSNTLEEQCHPRKIFIGGLAHKTTTQHLRDHFGRFGPIVDAVVLRWPDGRSRGFGYVTFADSHAAAGVLKENHQLSGRDVDVKRAVPGTNKLFVGGLPQNTAANELRDHFEKFGVVSDAVVMIDPATGRSRGFGFVCFLPGQEGAAAVTSALQQYSNHRMRGKWIEVKSAAPPHKLAKNGGSADGADYVPSYEELALSGALDAGRPKPSPSPSPSPSENSRTSENCKGDSKLGSPRKVILPANSELGESVRSPPPGLTAPLKNHSLADVHVPAASPWQPWANPWMHPFAGGFGPLPFGFPSAPLEMNSAGYPGFNTDYLNGPQGLDQSGFSAAEGLQRNLELFLRQSVQQKIDGKGSNTPRDPSVTSTTCSASTQTQVEEACISQL